jgi:acyl-homoserine lactone acylase PvdQ
MKIVQQTITLLLLIGTSFSVLAQVSSKESIRLTQLAKRVTIIRDQWGIAHVYGTTDADAVFGMLYAQCEDDFKRVEMNYIEKLGRLSEIKGSATLYNDLETRLLIDVAEAKSDYQKAAPWLKKLLNSYADGINYYLYKNPNVKPLLLTHFEPWFPLLWTDGSIGAISTADITTQELKDFYGKPEDKIAFVAQEKDMQTGSNGFALAPNKTASGNAILYINPHTTFYFRPEIQISSEEGLQAYGAVTWGQFFIYQGFNENCGWMHTSCNVDVADTYIEKIVRQKGKLFYKYENKLLPIKEKKITIQYVENGRIIPKTFTTFFTHHGPIMAKRDNQWISLKSNNRSMNSLIQSWERTKSKNFVEYKKAMDWKANTSNNTVYADNKGNIAYWHGNFVPKRDPKLNWAQPVDGSIATTEWKGLHTVKETVHLFNPKNGWLQNCNSTPFSVSGNESPKEENYPPYMAPDGESYRGINAVRVLSKGEKYTLDKIIETGYNNQLPFFEELIPAVVNQFEKSIQNGETKYNSLSEAIQVLSAWDLRSNENSIGLTLANELGFKLDPLLRKTYIDQGELDQVENTRKFIQHLNPEQVLPQLQEVITELTSKFGTWKMPWGEINRFQRLSGDIDNRFDDAAPSLPISYTSVLWGALPAFKSAYQNNTKKRYGFSGNSFVCAVEFGPKVKAKSLLAGGNSGNPSSKHFNDQAERYQKAQFKEVLFYKEDVEKNSVRNYHPGE